MVCRLPEFFFIQNQRLLRPTGINPRIAAVEPILLHSYFPKAFFLQMVLTMQTHFRKENNSYI